MEGFIVFQIPYFAQFVTVFIWLYRFYTSICFTKKKKNYNNHIFTNIIIFKINKMNNNLFNKK